MPSSLRELDNPAWTSLTGPHARFALRHGKARRYPAAIAPFVAVPDVLDGQVWRDLAALAGPGSLVSLADPAGMPPEHWEAVSAVRGVQLDGSAVFGAPDHEAVRLTAADVPEMLELVARTKPGPFRSRTIELGTYLGIRRDGELIAMAGERLHPPGWTEISAVCTDQRYRGQGLATRLVFALAAEIRSRGETPFMHAAADNIGAIRLYESLGFRLRRPRRFVSATVPGAEPVTGPACPP
ncbi:GNAT family N-acetyltransferase [Sciscionella marina]|uniref:GNAT family N-acetyltransferase n=1 Tax=Sciscionella marina TaxID=508770 RepID=UPI00035EB771|nr:GNAT family N-acetyltransferase [Sciscionella marina]